MNRRDFLRQLALIGIGAAVFPLFPSAAEASWYRPYCRASAFARRI